MLLPFKIVHWSIKPWVLLLVYTKLIHAQILKQMQIESYMVKVNIVDYKCRGSFQAHLKEAGMMEFVAIHGNKK
jgi:hypothetical protein